MGSAAVNAEPAPAAVMIKPPHCLVSEQSVIGGVLLKNEAIFEIIEILKPEDFFSRRHQLIYRAILEQFESGQGFDAVTLADHLKQRGDLEEAGGLHYIGRMAKDTPSAANIEVYARQVKAYAVRRKMVSVGQGLVQKSLNTEGRDSFELIEEVEQQLINLRENRVDDNPPMVARDILRETISHLDELVDRDSLVTGVPTGFRDFDEMTTGLQPGDLVIVAGRPSMGKTSLAMNMAEHACLEGRTVAVFSLEMPKKALMMRMIASLGRINMQRMRTGDLEDADWHRLTHATAQLKDARLVIDDTAAISTTELRARARRIQREQGGLDLIVVDYLQLMRPPETGRGHQNRTEEVSMISRHLKAIAREFDCPVIALSQLNRGLEQRTNKRPVMADLRESGSIEQDADLIAFVYREEVYDDQTDQAGIAEVIIGKQRNGPIGTVRLSFISQYTRFEDMIGEDGFAESAF